MKEDFPHVNQTVNLKNWATLVRKGIILHQDLLENGNLLKADSSDYIIKKEKRLMLKFISVPGR